MTDDFTTAADRLAEVLATENAALAELDLPRAGAMLAAKTTAADAFVAAHAAFQRDPQGAVPGTRLLGLERLRALVEEYQLRLATAIKVQSRVIGIIARALPRAMHDPAASRYGAQGRTTYARPTAFAVSARA